MSNEISACTAKPFVKWAGGKGQLLKEDCVDELIQVLQNYENVYLPSDADERGCR